MIHRCGEKKSISKLCDFWISETKFENAKENKPFYKQNFNIIAGNQFHWNILYTSKKLHAINLLNNQ